MKGETERMGWEDEGIRKMKEWEKVEAEGEDECEERGGD